MGTTTSSVRSEASKHEARLHNGVASQPPSAVPEQKRQARVVTIAFSSPLVSAVKYAEEEYLSDEEFLDQDVNLPLDDSEESVLRCSQHDTKPTAPTPPQTPLREKGHRYEQYRAMTLNRRPVSRIDERDEDGDPHEMSLVHIKQSQEMTPAHRERSMIKARPSKGQNSSILCLTPLSEFSLHQIDLIKHPEESFVEGRLNPRALRPAHGSQALSVDALMKAITDAADGEIYWEHIRTLRLDQKGLSSLHSLKDYCPVLEELSAVGNQIPHLNGLPSSLRVLDFRQNQLTSLVSWSALSNLQYVDISGNQLESLNGFGCLVHLRKLIVNDNHIKNLDGVMDLNGLLELEVRGNDLIDVDFDESELVRLRKIDLGSNEIRSIRNLHRLTSLEDLDVSHNQLVTLPGKIEVPGSLRTLRAAENSIEEFNLSDYTGIKIVDLDKNQVTTVCGLEEAYGLESLSLRGQVSVSDLVSNILSTPNECRELLLSSNLVPEGMFELPQLPQCNLRKLELSNCGISLLPIGFGELFLNCRSLNLNFNGLGDLSTLRGMHKLTVLEIARNRIKRMRRTCLVLSRFKRLTKLDVRDNPLSLGFYPPQQSSAADHRPEVYYNNLRRRIGKDDEWMGLLDETTKLKRRTIELLLADRCPNLRALDGADFVGQGVLKTDPTWDILMHKGVLAKPSPLPPQESETKETQQESSGMHTEGQVDTDGMGEERSLMIE